jgi:hypothetical protein
MPERLVHGMPTPIIVKRVPLWIKWLRMRTVWELLHSSRFLAFAALFGSFSCHESLPPYQDPSQVFVGVLVPTYLFSNTLNALGVQLVVTNVYDETFEARTQFEGSIEITHAVAPEYRKTFFLSAANLIQGKYNTGSRTLTFDRGDSVRLGVQWNFVDDRGRDLRQELFAYRVDRTCSPDARRISVEQSFVIRGRVKLFDRTEEVSGGPIRFTFCHVSRWVDPRACPSILPDRSCSFGL